MSDAAPQLWGPLLLEGGQARFRLWAPAHERLTLRTESGDLPMEAVGDGWFELVTDKVAPGQGYGFLLPDGMPGGGMVVPDPAARAQMEDVHGLSKLVDPGGFAWRQSLWEGRPWEEAVVYELHVGSFSEQGTFAGVEEKLDHLIDLGVTAIEIMPVAQFGGTRGWGYDGVLLYAPHNAYGEPDDLKQLVDAAHARGLMVLLDVVYNHFGPDGNYLHLYAPDFFDPERQTPWGPVIDYTRPEVRAFARENVLYWLEEFRLDGLRFDAIDQIDDPSEVHILEEIARTVRERITERPIHLTTEDSRNVVHLHRRDEAARAELFTAEWNDDFHNAAHVIATGEGEGYYRDFTKDRFAKLARTLTDGYAFQGEVSIHAGDRPRGEPSRELPPVAFVNFLQNHDQAGNRAFGERLIDLAERRILEVLTATLILSPAVPLLFMGEEWGETRPFCFFTDFHGDLAAAVREGRRKEFAAWASFSEPETRERIPDPNAIETFWASQPDWAARDSEDGKAWLAFYRSLLALRREEIVPRLTGMGGESGSLRRQEEGLIAVTWTLGDGARLHLDLNLESDDRAQAAPAGSRLFAWPDRAGEALASEGRLPAQSLVVTLEEGAE